MGAKITLCGPPNLIPMDIRELGLDINCDINEVLSWAEAVNVLRIQRERQGTRNIPSVREYRGLYGVTKERIERLKKEIMRI